MKTFIRLLIVALSVITLAGCGGIFKLTPLDEYEALEQAEKAGAAAKISDLAAATVAAADDVVSGVDVSHTDETGGMAASGTTKKFPFSVMSTFFNSDLAVDDLITLSGLAKGSTAITGAKITATTFDGALTELADAVELNTAKVSFAPLVTDDIIWGAAAGTDKTWTWDTGSGTDPAVNISDSGFSFNKPLLTSVPDGQRWMSAPNTTALAEIGVNTALTGSELAELGDKWYRYDATGDDWDDFILFNETVIVDTNNDITATTINGALMEFAAAIELNTAKNTMAWPSAAGVAIYGGSSAWGTSLTLGVAANNIPQLDASAHLGATAGRIVKGWFTDLTVTNAIAGSVTGNAAGLSSTLVVGSGGTGATTLTDGGILLGSGTGAITALGVATNGQIPIGDGTTDPVLANITETGDALVVTNGAGTIDLSAHANVEAVADAAATDGNFLVGNGTAFVAESGATARNSIGLGTGDSPEFAGINITGFINGGIKPIALTKSSGVHDGDANATTLTDSGESFTTSQFVGMTVYNKTDGSSCTVTANNGTTITCTLAGGTDNDWDVDDVWQVGPGPKQSGSAFYVAAAGTIRHPATAGYAAIYYIDAAAALIVDPVSASTVIKNATASAIDAGDSIDSPSTAGSFIALHNASTTVTYALGRNGTWTDGGAD